MKTLSVVSILLLPALGFSQVVKQPPKGMTPEALKMLEAVAEKSVDAAGQPLRRAAATGSEAFDKQDPTRTNKIPVAQPDGMMGKTPKATGGIVVDEEPGKQDDDEGGPKDQLKKMLIELMKDKEFSGEVDKFVKSKVDVAKDHALNDPKVKKLSNGLDNLAVKLGVMGVGAVMAAVGFATGNPIVGGIGVGLFAGALIISAFSWLFR